MASSYTAAPLKVDPLIDLPTAFSQIEADRAAQVGDVNSFGKSQDQNLQNIYGQLQQGLGQSSAAQQQNYGTAASNIGKAYDVAGTNTDAASAQVQGGIREMAQRLGLDTGALNQVAGTLAQQAAAFDQRNASSKANRVTSMDELGAKMGAVAQMGIQAAQQAEAQGRKDLSTRITTELQRIQASAARARTDFTGIKTQQLYRETLQAQSEIRQATAQLVSEQRQQRAQADSEARMQASQANSDRNYQLALTRMDQSSSKMSPLDLFIAEQQYGQQNPKLTAGNQDYRSLYQQDQNVFGPAGRQALDMLLGGVPPKDVFSRVKSNGNDLGNQNDIIQAYAQLMQLKNAG